MAFKKRTKQPTDDELRELAPHIYYEALMLDGAVSEFYRLNSGGIETLPRSDRRRIARTTFLEAILLHARILDDFLRYGRTDGKDDDVFAAHYIPAWTPASPLDGLATTNGVSVRSAMNKHLAHLTTDRLTPTRYNLPSIAQPVLAALAIFARDQTNTQYHQFDELRELLKNR